MRRRTGPDNSPDPSVSFACTNCEQVAGVRADGRNWMLQATIFPSEMSPKMHHEFAEHWRKERLFFSQLMVVAGYRDGAVHRQMAEYIDREVDRYKGEHPIPQRHWLRKLVGA